MKSEFEIRVNGQRFTLWEKASINRSLDTLCGSFTFVTSYKPSNYPVKLGDTIQILINGISIITGFVFEIMPGGSERSDTVTVAGRDKTADILDSSLPNNAKNTEGVTTLKALCEKVISGLGADIKVIDQTGGISSFKAKDSEYGASISNSFDFLYGFARKRQTYLITNGEGNLVLFKPSINNKASSAILHEYNGVNNNVKKWNAVLSNTQRFNKYVCRSSDNYGFDDDSDYSEGSGNDRIGKAIDSEIRASRYLEILAEESMDNAECVKRAKEEANLRRAKGIVYNCTVAGAVQADGSLWDIGQFVKVRDDFAGVKGLFIINSIACSQDISEGTLTQMQVSQPDAYQAKDVIDKQTARKASIGEKF